MNIRPGVKAHVMAALFLGVGMLGACAPPVDGTGDSPTPSLVPSTSKTAAIPWPSAADSSVTSSSQPPSATPSDPPQEFYKELDKRATASGVHSGAEIDGLQVSVWFQGDPGQSFRSWAQTER